MDDELPFRKLERRRFPKPKAVETSETSYWRSYKVKITNQTGSISWLSFSSDSSRRLAATSGTRVVLYDKDSLKPSFSLSKFKDLAHCGSFRQDGKLLAAGSEDGSVKVLRVLLSPASSPVQVFNIADKSVLRQLEGHQRPVHVSHFSSDLLNVFSAADDATVRLWDLSEGKQILRLDGHRDYVRCGMQSPTSSHAWATGGYDHVCRIWDVREQDSRMELDHGAPIEAITYLPSGTLLVTAGGPFLCVWDVLGTGRMLRRLEKHHKTITAVGMINCDELSGPRLISTSLDRHLKIYDLTEFKVVHDSRYKSPILSFASAADGRSYAVGMSDGTVVMRDNRHRVPPAEPVAALPGTIARKRFKISEIDSLLRKFRYKDVLDLVMRESDVGFVAAVIEELAARDGLVAALSDRSQEDLIHFMRYISRQISNPQFAEHVMPLLELLLRIYGTDLSLKPLDKTLNNIYKAIQREISVLTEMKGLKGALEFFN